MFEVRVRTIQCRCVIIEPGVIKNEFTNVMFQPMVDRAKGSVYEKMTNSVASTTKEMYAGNSISPSSVIAKLVSKAVKSKNPNTMYVAGKYAKPMMFMRKYFGDKIFDRIIMSQIK